jgi:hypothetical protein
MTSHQNPTPVVDTVPALAGVVFAAAAAVQFLQAEIVIGVFDMALRPSHAIIISLAALVVAFASSDSRDWRYLDGWEQALVGFTIVFMLAHQYSPDVQAQFAQHQPITGSIVFLAGMVSWGVLAR